MRVYLKLAIVLFLLVSFSSQGQLVNSNSQLYQHAIDTVLNSIPTKNFTGLAMRIPHHAIKELPNSLAGMSTELLSGKRNKTNDEQLLMIVTPLQVNSDTLNIRITLFHKPEGSKTYSYYADGLYMVKYLYSEEIRTYYICRIEKGFVL